MRGKTKRTLLISLLTSISSIIINPSLGLAGEEHAAGKGKHPKKEVKVILDEYSFQVKGTENDSLTLKVGDKVEIEFENIGLEGHEAMFGKGLHFEEDEKRAHGYKKSFFENVEVEIKGTDFEVETRDLKEIYLEPESKLKIEFTVPRGRGGEWEMGCFRPGHYKEGMHIPLLVKE